jgi:hypothetical protein
VFNGKRAGGPQGKRTPSTNILTFVFAGPPPGLISAHGSLPDGRFLILPKELAKFQANPVQHARNRSPGQYHHVAPLSRIHRKMEPARGTHRSTRSDEWRVTIGEQPPKPEQARSRPTNVYLGAGTRWRRLRSKPTRPLSATLLREHRCLGAILHPNTLVRPSPADPKPPIWRRRAVSAGQYPIKLKSGDAPAIFC